MASGEQMKPIRELKFTILKEETMERKRSPRLERRTDEPERTRLQQFADKPKGVPAEEWEQYLQLVTELEGAECILHNIRARLEAAEQRLVRQIKDYHCAQDGSLERLVVAAPVTKLLQ